ncbi:hypothetical protein PTI98_010234 [Pleurotus ostreatus]|nr:hypothetical protein PTI98_010234 [Pleurotus ostreatus]
MSYTKVNERLPPPSHFRTQAMPTDFAIERALDAAAQSDRGVAFRQARIVANNPTIPARRTGLRPGFHSTNALDERHCFAAYAHKTKQSSFPRTVLDTDRLKLKLKPSTMATTSKEERRPVIAT